MPQLQLRFVCSVLCTNVIAVRTVKIVAISAGLPAEAAQKSNVSATYTMTIWINDEGIRQCRWAYFSMHFTLMSTIFFGTSQKISLKYYFVSHTCAVHVCLQYACEYMIDKMHTNVHCFNTFTIKKYPVEDKRKIRHQMFTIQIFCSYSINYKTFKLICSENNAYNSFFSFCLSCEHSTHWTTSAAHRNLETRTINRTKKYTFTIKYYLMICNSFCCCIFFVTRCL